jgi:HD-GYP domain-containing protein (c-di-GMP phosphodiesterase class II)
MAASGRLMLVPMSYLAAGMQISEDIYSHSGSLLLRAGSKVDSGLIEKLKAANNGQPHIYVSERTYQQMRAVAVPQERGRAAAVTVNKKLEQETGYSGIVENSAELFKEVLFSSEASIEAAPVLTVSSEISHRLETTETDVIFDLVNTIAPTDEYLRRHIINVSMLNGLFGRWLGLPQAETDELISVGLLHDTGKMMIPPEVLNAPRRLSVFEFEVIKMHTVYGAKLLSGFPDHIREGARHHHEKTDGSGYPDGLKGNEMPLTARITAVSDIYDAMVSSRCYKGPESPFTVLAMLADMRGKTLDAKIVDIFLRKMPNELIGKQVLLSNGGIGKVEQIDYADIANPFVSLNGKNVKTGKDLKCVSMYAV